ncbi:gp60 [Mycobacterium phage Konstantine]|uniref:Uncharacterized protein n=2 Tax=Konstantinevirus TaxID=2843403 RepID=B5U530_9CAUD|nr:gp60 [Mycobacterium phage Konstantine]ACI12476.1 hypothetical protein KONSTANTINE_60 [Mycobacterium phage Konstantine]AXH47182.1 hypothetical protein SEA_CBORCH11_58 [Mycobacterium phage Cborch11]
MSALQFPCSPRHRHCSMAHAELVRDYRAERERQETEQEMILSSPGERKRWEENGGRLINFQDWILAHKGRNENPEC